MIKFSVSSFRFSVRSIRSLKKSWLGFVGPALAVILACSSPSEQEFSGPELIGRLGCLACHGLGGSAAAGGFYLDGIGSRLSRPALKESLTHPRRRRPGVKMPSYAYVRPGELEELVGYLERLK
ncbi:MAG: c-type cytochrome [Deltaproteobacteria bacterium]|nr:c-type cytochrome [Deltaproteobacteria bacterium]